MKKTMADEWAAEVWRKNLSGWENRKQDYNYRKLLARPAMQEMLHLLATIKNGVFLDLGCGDGSEMLHISNSLVSQGNSGTFYGFDLQKNLIDVATERFCDNNSMNFVFDSGELPLLVRRYGFNKNVDRVFSTFLLQELSSAEKYFKITANCLSMGGKGIFLLLDPQFADAMLQKDAIKINSSLSQSSSFEWAGEYPIVEENGNTFYVPYFHRSLKYYTDTLRKYFSTFQIFSKQPTRETIQKAHAKRLSPFYGHPGNVYYPEIINIPSALFFVVSK